MADPNTITPSTDPLNAGSQPGDNTITPIPGLITTINPDPTPANSTPSTSSAASTQTPVNATKHTYPPVFYVEVNGVDCTSRFNPYLESIKIMDLGGGIEDKCDIVLDDSYGQLAMPNTGASVTVGLGWTDTGPINCFSGVIDSVESEGSRDRGRTLTLVCTSSETSSASKTSNNMHADQMSLSDVASKWGAMAGLTVKIDPSLDHTRVYWAQQNESFLQWMDRIGGEIGGIFKVQGKQAVLSRMNSTTSVSGAAMSTINCVVGQNVIHWAIKPLWDRVAFKNFTTNFYDPAKAIWNIVSSFGGDGQADKDTATFNDKFKAPNAQQAALKANSNEQKSLRISARGGTITIDGEPTAKCNSTVIVRGARQGIDDTYRADSAIHTYNRRTGFTTEMQISEPAGSGGSSDSAAAAPDASATNTITPTTDPLNAGSTVGANTITPNPGLITQ